MRKWNAITGALILLLFLVHAVVGAYQVWGILPGGVNIIKALSWAMMGLLTAHILLGSILTVRTLCAIRKSGVSYFRANLLFWGRRLSGFALLILVILHTVLFLGYTDGAYRLSFFGGFQLAVQILLLVVCAFHVICNVKPLLLSFGIGKLKRYTPDIVIVLSALFLFFAIAFVIYYIRWL